MKNYQYAEYSTSLTDLKSVDAHSLMNDETKNTTFKAMASQNNIKSDIRQALDEAPRMLAFASEEYNISKDIKDYILVPSVIMPSDLPNKNGVAFPYEELTKFSVDYKNISYKTWANCPSHIEHCFPAEAPITTNKGKKSIKEIDVGDKVLTHNRNYKKVIRKFKNGTKSVTEIKCMGLIESIYATENHPFWVVDGRQFYDNSYYGYEGLKLRQFNDKNWENLKPHFKEVSNIYKGDFLCVPIRIGGNKKVNKDFAFLTGVHMAEGSYSWSQTGKLQNTVITINVGEKELRDKIVGCLENLDLPYSIHFHKVNNTCNINVRDKKFAKQMLRLTGEYSHQKEMKPALRKWNKVALKWFLGGYISGDGCVSQHWGGSGSNNNRYLDGSKLRCRTVSKNLANDIWQTMCYLGIQASINPDQKINGTRKHYCDKYNVMRYVEYKESYCVGAMDTTAYKLNKYIVNKPIMKPAKRDYESRHNNIRLRGNYLLVPVTEINRNVKSVPVYNIEVEDDNSYIAYNVAVHNCNDEPRNAKGMVFASFMKKMPGYKGDIYKVICLVGCDRSKDKILANEVLDQSEVSTSMGALCEDYRCSITGNLLSSGKAEQYTKRTKPSFQTVGNKLAFLSVVNFHGIEVSFVKNPAYTSARSKHKFTYDT